MLKNNYFARLKALFFEKGISQRQSDHLIEELQDHLALEIAKFQARGNNPTDSERLAMESVGAPEDIAEKAAADLQSGWLMQYAWLPCGGGFFLASLLTMFAIMLLGYHLSGDYGYDNGDISRPSLSIIQVEVILFNWLPLLIGLAGIAFIIRFSSIGWKSIFFTAIALGIVVSAEEMRIAISPVADSTKLCFLELDDSFILQWLKLGSGISVEHEPNLLTVFRLFAPLGICLFARYVQPHIAASKNLIKVRYR
jgi:hypothetical protein